MDLKRVKEFFGHGTEKIRGKKWDWDTFETTEGYPIPDELLSWVIGQDKAMQECFLCLDEWVHKLTWLKKKKWWKFWEKPETEKSTTKDQLPAGPYLLLLGDVGTGKSLMGKALAEKLTNLYKEHGIDLYDVVCWANKVIPSEPQITVHPAGEGKKLVTMEKLKTAKKARVKSLLIRIATYFMTTVATLFVSIGLYWLWQVWTQWYALDGNVGAYGKFIPLMDWMMSNFVGIGATTFLPAGMMLIFLILIVFMGRFGAFGSSKGIGGAEQTEAPKLIVDNSQCIAPFLDATGHKSSQLFGDIAWDPLQTGGLGTPEHQRVSAGDVHRALMGILYIDEIKNLEGGEAVTLLTVLEDGQLPIALRSRWSEGGTAAMAVSTQPVPCMTFLVAAGNFDSIPQIHPALMDRITGYGKVVRMNNDMPDTIENRRKYIQFITQETTRFHMPPFTRKACIELIDEARRRSGKAKALTTKFRPLIAIIKTAGTLALNEGKTIVEDKYVLEAINEHCKTIQMQLLEHEVTERNKYKDVRPNEPPKIGQVYGLAVLEEQSSGDTTGSIIAVKGSMVKKSSKKQEGYFDVTGINKGGGLSGATTWITDSVEKVRHVIIQKFGIDPAQDYMTHIDFAQELGIDGPSAGVTMAVALCSILDKKPLRQDIAITGEINIGIDKRLFITPVGGIYHKIKAAEAWGFKGVVVPKKNFEHNVIESDFKIKIYYGETLEDYMKILYGLVD